MEDGRFKEHPEVRNRALIFSGESRAGKDEVVRQASDMTETHTALEAALEAHGEQDSETIYAVVEDGVIGVITKHHSVVESYVKGSLTEGEGVTIDVQTFEVDL